MKIHKILLNTSIVILFMSSCSAYKEVGNCNDGEPRFIYKKNLFEEYESEVKLISKISAELTERLKLGQIDLEKEKKVRKQIEDLDQFTATFYHQARNDYELFRMDPCDRNFKNKISNNLATLAKIRMLAENGKITPKEILVLINQKGLGGNIWDTIINEVDEFIKLISS